MLRSVAVALACALPVLACLTKSSDGGSCSSGSDCKSGRCTPDGVCGGSDCSCGTEKCTTDPSSDCESGWLCAHYAADPITGFFGASGGNACTPTCGSCPAGTYCAEGGQPGKTLCSSGKQPPAVTIEGPSEAVQT